MKNFEQHFLAGYIIVLLGTTWCVIKDIPSKDQVAMKLKSVTGGSHVGT